MLNQTPDVKPTSATPAAPASSASQVPPVSPATPTAGGGKVPDAVPYNRFQEVTVKNRELAEENDMLRNRLQSVKQPTPSPSPHATTVPDAEEDPLGHITKRLDQQSQMIADMNRRSLAQDGKHYLDQVKTDYPIFADKDLGQAALDLLSKRLEIEQGLKTPARVVREVAEIFSNVKVNTNNAVPDTKLNNANATASLSTGSPDVGAVLPAPFKPKTFDEAHKAAGARWRGLEQKMRESAQV